MATITLEYDRQARQMVGSNGFLVRKKSGLEEALEDIANGRVTTIHIPKNRIKPLVQNTMV